RLRAYQGGVPRDAHSGDCQWRRGNARAFRSCVDRWVRRCGAGRVYLSLRHVHRRTAQGGVGPPRHPGETGIIFSCIDLMDGKVVQLVQGREKALEGGSPDEMLRTFAAFPEIQVIDLDAAMGRGSNDELVRYVASKTAARVGGGIRTVERARDLIEQ